jgi:glutamyl-tRNA synthetase
VPLGVTTQFDDAVFGPREISNDEIEDFVLLRSPRAGQQQGLPTYQLAAVVDDVDMRITHVIRGADHLSNTPKQVLLYRALGAPPPRFYHCPLMTDEKGVRLAKRHDALSLRRLRAQGLSPAQLRAQW